MSIINIKKNKYILKSIKVLQFSSQLLVLLGFSGQSCHYLFIATSFKRSLYELLISKFAEKRADYVQSYFGGRIHVKGIVAIAEFDTIL